MNKRYTTGEMIDLLFQNTKRTAKCYIEPNASIEVYWESGYLKCNENLFSINEMYKGYNWIVINPPKEKLTFAKAFIAFQNGNIIKSLVTNTIYKNSIAKDEILSATEREVDGFWELQ